MLKPKKCKFCKNTYTPTKPLSVVCSATCAFGLARINGLKKMENEIKTKRKEQKEKLKGSGDYKRELQTIINHIARLIDEGCPCISSGRLTGKMSGGHRFAVGGWSNLRFNLLNIWIQSFKDNHHLSGSPTNYDINLMRMGIYDLVHDLPSIYPTIKLSIDDLKEAIIKAKHIRKGLIDMNKTEKLPRSYERRIELRTQFNKYIGIYE